MSRMDDVFTQAEAQAAQFRDLMNAAGALYTEIHNQGWDAGFDPALIKGANLDIVPELPAAPNQTPEEAAAALAARQAEAAARLGLGMGGYLLLLQFVNNPANEVFKNISRMAR